MKKQQDNVTLTKNSSLMQDHKGEQEGKTSKESSLTTKVLIDAKFELGILKDKKSNIESVTIYGLGEPRYISIENAKRLLSLDADGIKHNKENVAGGSAVTRLGKVYFKFCPSYETDGPRMYLTEQAVYQMSLLLGGEIISPTRFLVLEFPLDTNNVVKKYMLQASLAIEGIHLEDLLSLPKLIKDLLNALGDTRLKQDFPALLQRSYYQEWLNEKGIDPKLTWKEQCEWLAHEIYNLRLSERPSEYKNESWTKNLIAKNISENKTLQAASLPSAESKGVTLLPILALMSKYKEVSIWSLTDLFLIYRRLESLKQLYPDSTLEEILKELPILLSQRFDPENISKHFLLALLTNPQDHHQGGNFKVRVHRDPTGKILFLEIIGIDNDRALEGAIQITKSIDRAVLEYSVLTKTLFYGITEFLEMDCSASVTAKILNLVPETAIRQWLAFMIGYAEPYLRLDLHFGNRAQQLHQHLYSTFPGFAIARLKELQTLLRSPRTHKKLWFELEPLLSRYSEELLILHGGDPVRFAYALRKEATPKLLGLLELRKQSKESEAKTINETLQKLVVTEPNYSSYRESFNSLMQESLPDGSTSIHFASIYCPHIIEYLIQEGIRLDTKNKHGKTALDVAIEHGAIEGIKILLSLGAGRFVSLENGIACISNFSIHTDICQSLLSQNADLSWHFALEFISDKKVNKENVSLAGPRGRNYLRPEIYQQIFEFKQGKYIFRKHNILFGRHNVAAIRFEIYPGITFGMHLKEKPELLVRELMAHHLGKNLFGQITPQIAIMRFICQEGSSSNDPTAFPIMASRSIEGKTLREVLDHFPHELALIDKQSFSEALILALLINPEDGRADQYILQPFIQGSQIRYRLVSIDNEQAYVRPLAKNSKGEEIEGPEGLQVKTILYCLNEMQEPLNKNVRERLLDLDPAVLLKQWLQDLTEEQKKIDAIFVTDEKNKLQDRKGIYLNIVLRSRMAIELRNKLIMMKKILSEYPDCSGLMLLRQMIPNLSIRYIDAFYKYDTVDERFNAISKGCFGKKFVQRPLFDLYILPESKINLLAPTGIEGNAVVLSQDKWKCVDAYFVRNGQWVTRGSPAKLLKILLGACMLSDFLVDDRGLIARQHNNIKMIEEIINLAIYLLKDRKEYLMSMSTSTSIVMMSNEKTLKQEHDLLPEKVIEELDKYANIENERSLLQKGEIDSFLTSPFLSTLDREEIVNGRKGVPGIDFGLMKTGGKPNLKLQLKILNALSQIEFSALRIRNCSILTVGNLINVLKNSKGLSALSLHGCEKITDVGISSLKQACPKLSALELNNINIAKINCTLPQLKSLKIIQCKAFKYWEGEFSQLSKLKLRDCPLILNADFYHQYPFLFSLSPLLESSPANITILTTIDNFMKNCLMKKAITFKLLPFQTRKEIARLLKDYFKAINPIDIDALYQNLLGAIKHKDLNVKEEGVSALQKLGPRLSVGPLKSALESLQVTMEDESSYSQFSMFRFIVTHSLIDLSSKLNLEQLGLLFVSMKDRNEYEYVTKAAIIALDKLSPTLDGEQLKSVLDILFVALSGKGLHIGLNYRKSSIGQAAANALVKIIPRLDAEQFNQVLKKLLDSMTKDFVEVLTELGPGLNIEQMKSLLEILLAVIKQEYSVVNRPADALNNLVIGLSSEQWKSVLEVLFQLIEGQGLRVSIAVDNALYMLFKQFGEEPLTSLSNLLLQAMKSEIWEVKKVATSVLCRLTSKFNQQQLLPVLEALIDAMEYIYSDIRSTTIVTLGKLSSKLSIKQINLVFERLIVIITNEESAWNPRKVAICALGDLRLELNTEQLTSALKALFIAIPNGDADTQSISVTVLGKLGLRCNKDQFKQVLQWLLKLAYNEESLVKKAVAGALSKLSLKLRAEQVLLALEALFTLLQEKDPDIQFLSVTALDKLGPECNVDQLKQVVERLLVLMKNKDHNVMKATADTLAALTPRLNTKQLNLVLCALVNFDITYNSLVKLGSKLNAEQLKVVLEKLFKPIDTEALIKLGSGLKPEHLKSLLQQLLIAIKDKDWRVREGTGRVISFLGSSDDIKQMNVVLRVLPPVEPDSIRFVEPGSMCYIAPGLMRYTQHPRYAEAKIYWDNPGLPPMRKDAFYGNNLNAVSLIKEATYALDQRGQTHNSNLQELTKEILDQPGLIHHSKSQKSLKEAFSALEKLELSSTFSEEQLKLSLKACLVATKDENGSINVLKNIVSKLLPKNLEIVVKVLWEERTNKIEFLSFFTDMLLDVINNKYLDTHVLSEIEKLFSRLAIGSSESKNSDTTSLEPYLPNKENLFFSMFSETHALVNDNCAINAFALGIIELILDKFVYFSKHSETVKEINKALNLRFLDQRELSVRLEQEQDPAKQQTILVPILRILAVEYIESHYSYYQEALTTDLLSAYELFKTGKLDETFCCHPHILKKFNELLYKNTALDMRAAKRQKEEIELKIWWEAITQGKGPRKEYFANLKQEAEKVGNIKFWSSKIDNWTIQALAFSFGISVQCSEDKNTQLWGVGNGLVSGLSQNDIQHLTHLKVGSKFNDGFRIEVNRTTLTKQLNLETLSENERCYLDENGRKTVLTFISNANNIPEADRKITKELCEKLERMGLLERQPNKQLKFVDVAVFDSILKPVPDAFKTRITAEHIEPLAFSIKKEGSHWLCVKVDALSESIKSIINKGTAEDQSRRKSLFFFFQKFHSQFNLQLCDLINEYASCPSNEQSLNLSALVQQTTFRQK